MRSCRNNPLCPKNGNWYVLPQGRLYLYPLLNNSEYFNMFLTCPCDIVTLPEGLKNGDWYVLPQGRLYLYPLLRRETALFGT